MDLFPVLSLLIDSYSDMLSTIPSGLQLKTYETITSVIASVRPALYVNMDID